MAAAVPFLIALDCDEIEAVVLGSQWVTANGDPLLARAALTVVGKIAASSPETLRAPIEAPIVGTPPPKGRHEDSAIDVARLRSWTRQQRKLMLRYVNGDGILTVRTVWPVLIGYGATSRMLIAWCELRHDFRMFRTDRLTAVEFLDEPYPHDRADLRRRWLTLMEERDEQLGPVRPDD